MTTTTHPKLNRIIALRDQARGAGTTEAERETFMAKARELCIKYGIDQAILTEAPKQTTKSFIDGSRPQEKKFTCRFGCGLYVQHTIDELNACAEKARNANGGNAYAGQAKARDPWDDINDFFRTAGTNRRSGASSHNPNAGQARARTTGSHAYCDHEATKSARAKCRKARGY